MILNEIMLKIHIFKIIISEFMKKYAKIIFVNNSKF